MVHLNSDGKASLGSGIAFTTLALLAVGLRLLTKIYTKAAWAHDDSWAVMSLAALFAWLGVEFWGIFSGGGGANIETIILASEFATLRNYLKSLYTLSPIYGLTITLARLSILYLYRRIFSVGPFRQISLAVIIICVVWWMVFTITTLIPCRPVKKFWQPQVAGSCYNFDEFFLGIAVIDVILDTVVLTLPIRMIVRLQMSYQRKVMLCFVFLLGGFVIITGIVRTILVYVPHSQNISFTKGELWTNIHLGTAVVCASLPTFPPLLSRFAAFGGRVRSRLSSLLSRRRLFRESEQTNEYTMTRYPDGQKRYTQLEDPTGDKISLTGAAELRASQTGSLTKYWDRNIGRVSSESAAEIV